MGQLCWTLVHFEILKAAELVRRPVHYPEVSNGTRQRSKIYWHILVKPPVKLVNILNVWSVVQKFSPLFHNSKKFQEFVTAVFQNYNWSQTVPSFHEDKVKSPWFILYICKHGSRAKIARCWCKNTLLLTELSLCIFLHSFSLAGKSVCAHQRMTTA